MLLRKFGSSGSIIDFLPKKFFTVAQPLKRVNENNIISEDHIKDFFRSKLFTGLYTKLKEPLHSFPISYRIDNRKSVSDPIGMKANNLLTKWHIISVSKDYLELIY